VARGHIAITPFQQAFDDSGLSAYEVAARAGWERVHKGRRRPDASRVLRALGRKGDEPQDRLTESVAKRLAFAMNLDPVDLDF
jgi:hypothetical protein